jgi:Type II secretion system (T2SS), protein G
MKKAILAALILVITATTAFAGTEYVPTKEERGRWTHGDMHSWRIVLDAYKQDYNAYPTASNLQTVRPMFEPVYIRTLPLHDAWGNDYRFESTAETYKLTSAGADGKFGSEDDIVLTPRQK